ncbi:hypothetical protein AA958_08970 [Streptomyces sp. CNQ-509]|nr:hypothetical protein AA958_08970 [Streptomyces sp. CNQ-509]
MVYEHLSPQPELLQAIEAEPDDSGQPHRSRGVGIRRRTAAADRFRGDPDSVPTPERGDSA